MLTDCVGAGVNCSVMFSLAFAVMFTAEGAIVMTPCTSTDSAGEGATPLNALSVELTLMAIAAVAAVALPACTVN